MDKCYKLHNYIPRFKSKGVRGPTTNQVAHDPQKQSMSIRKFLLLEKCKKLLNLLYSQNANECFANTSTVDNSPKFHQSFSNLSCICLFVAHIQNFSHPTFSTLLTDHYSLLTNTKMSSKCSIPWVINTGANGHMVNYISFLTSITSIVTGFIKLLNGNQVPISHGGTI